MKKIKDQKFKLERQKIQLEEKLRDADRKCKDREEDYSQLQLLYEELGEKFRRRVQDLEGQIGAANREIHDERRKADRRRNEME